MNIRFLIRKLLIKVNVGIKPESQLRIERKWVGTKCELMLISKNYCRAEGDTEIYKLLKAIEENPSMFFEDEDKRDARR